MDGDDGMGIHFQEDTIMEILSWLPVQSLLQFKCVSKVWMTLISEPYFITKHLKNSRNSQKLLVSLRYRLRNEYTLYTCPLSSVQRIEEVQKLDYPCVKGRPCRCKIYCSYDNLVIVGVSDYEHDRVLLWNPSTRESILLPDSIIPPKEGDIWTWGLGYDSTSDDYKILKIDLDTKGEILELKSGSWRLTDKHPTISFKHCVISYTDSLAFVHQAFHWLDLSLSSYVVSFSISDEVYTEIPLLEEIYSEWFVQGVSVLGEMLCVHSRYEPSNFKIWVMKEYGVKESWTELFNIRGGCVYSIIPKYRFSDGDVLLIRYNQWDLCSTVRTSKGPFGLWPQSHVIQNLFVYTESLFFPKLN